MMRTSIPYIWCDTRDEDLNEAVTLLELRLKEPRRRERVVKRMFHPIVLAPLCLVVGFLSQSHWLAGLAGIAACYVALWLQALLDRHATHRLIYKTLSQYSGSYMLSTGVPWRELSIALQLCSLDWDKIRLMDSPRVIDSIANYARDADWYLLNNGQWPRPLDKITERANVAAMQIYKTRTSSE